MTVTVHAVVNDLIELDDPHLRPRSAMGPTGLGRSLQGSHWGTW